MRQLSVLILVLTTAMLVLSGCSQRNDETGMTAYNADKVKLNFYVMSQCPYGVMVEDAVKPVLDKLGDAVEFKLDFIGRKNADGSFQSLHGQPEVNGDIIQLCAAKHEPEKYMKMVACMNKDMNAIPNNWKECAEADSLDAEKIEECYRGEEGQRLLEESFKRAEEAQARGSPTIYLNGEAYQGGRDSISFQRALCNKLNNHPQCKNIPECGSDVDCSAQPDKIGKCINPNENNALCVYSEPLKFKVKVLNDDDCPACDTSQIIATTKRLFKGAEIDYLDVDSEEGKKLVEENRISLAPAYLFEKKVEETVEWAESPQISSAFEKKPFGYKLLDSATGASFFIDEIEKERFMKSVGIVLGDNKPQLDFFVMSYCPYGNTAEEAIMPVYELLGGKAEFKPHYVIYSNGEGCYEEDGEKEGEGDEDEESEGEGVEKRYCSMHGTQELHQNVRELCVLEQKGTSAWFKFAIEMNSRCNYKNADECWSSVAEELGYDVEKIELCEKEKGIEFSKADKILGDKLGVSGSPQVFIDGVEFKGERTPEGYKKALCNAFEDKPSECGKKLESVSGSQGTGNPSGGCSG